MLRKLTQTIISRWSGRRPATPPPLPPAGAGLTAASTSSAADARTERLDGIADENTRLRNGALHLISLEDLRDALGEEQWGVLSPQVSAAAARMLQHWLKPADTLKPRDDTGFLVEFDAFDGDAGARRANRLGLRLKAALVEQFPQLTDQGRGPTVTGSPMMARGTVLDPLEKSNTPLGADQCSMRGAELGLWRAALGQATIELLEVGTPVTIETLVVQLETGRNADSLVLRSASTGAAIALLRKIAADSRGSSSGEGIR